MSFGEIIFISGKVTGNFYDEKGLPTAALLAAKESIEEAHLKKKKDDEFSQRFPPCNSAYTSGEGWVSCSDKRSAVDYYSDVQCTSGPTASAEIYFSKSSYLNVSHKWFDNSSIYL